MSVSMPVDLKPSSDVAIKAAVFALSEGRYAAPYLIQVGALLV